MESIMLMEIKFKENTVFLKSISVMQHAFLIGQESKHKIVNPLKHSS